MVMKSTIGARHTIKSNVIYPMTEATNSESFEEIVEWAYGTLPQELILKRPKRSHNGDSRTLLTKQVTRRNNNCAA